MVSGKFDVHVPDVSAVSSGQESDVLLKKCEVETGANMTGEANQLKEKAIPTVPDGGYGWVIVAASFFCSFIVDGISYSFAVYLVEWSNVFQDSGKDTISWVGSLLNGVYLCMGPFSSALTNAYGFRAVIFAGSFVAATGFIASVYCESVAALMGTFGIIAGTGIGLVYSPSIMCVCYYFEKRRALAVGICVCGSGFGMVVFPPAIQLVVGYYGWEGSMFVLAGLALLLCVAGSFMKPLEVEVTDHIEIQSAPSVVPAEDTFFLDQPSSFRDLHRIKAPRVRNWSGSQPVSDAEMIHSRKSNSSHGIDVQAIGNGKPQNQYADAAHRHYFSTPDIAQEIHKVKRTEFLPPLARKDVVIQGSLKYLDRIPRERSQLELVGDGQNGGLRKKEVTEITEMEPSPKKSFLPVELRQALIELADFSIYKNRMFLIYSVSGFFGMVAFYIPFSFIFDFEKENIPNAPVRTVAGFEVSFLLPAMGITNEACIRRLTVSLYISYAPLVHSYRSLFGTCTLFGNLNIAGRLFWGWLTDRFSVDPLIVHNVAITIVAVIVAFIPACTDYYALISLCGLFGFFVCPFISLMSVILTSRIGLEQLPSAFGHSQFVRGIASMVGIPIGGYLYEITKDYKPVFAITFWVSSAEMILSVLIASIIVVMEFRQRRYSPHNKIPSEMCA